MRICIYLPTNKVLEMQTLATAGTLIRNALNAGYAANEIEEREVDDAGYAAIMAFDPGEVARKATQAQRRQDIAAAFPDWATVAAKFDQATTALNAATTLAQVKPIVQGMLNAMKLEARALYWLIKNSAT